jgi:hypothetical protein
MGSLNSQPFPSDKLPPRETSAKMSRAGRVVIGPKSICTRPNMVDIVQAMVGVHLASIHQTCIVDATRFGRLP